VLITTFMLNSFSTLTPDSIALPSFMDVCDKPFGLGFNFMQPFTYREKTVLISEDGKVYYQGKELNQYNNGSGYLSFTIRSKLFYTHRVVCTVYHGEPPLPSMQANHINGIRCDNRKDNLRWDTSSDNHKHAWKELGRIHAKNQSLRTGKDHQYSKPVDQLDPNTKEVIKTFTSIKEAADFFGVDTTAIYNSITKRNRAKYCKGFDWQYNPKGNQYKRKYVYTIENGIKKRKLNQ